MPSVLLTLVLTFSYVRLTKCIKRTYNEGCHVYVSIFPRVLYSKVLIVIRMNMAVNIRTVYVVIVARITILVRLLARMYHVT